MLSLVLVYSGRFFCLVLVYSGCSFVFRVTVLSLVLVYSGCFFCLVLVYSGCFFCIPSHSVKPGSCVFRVVLVDSESQC